MTMLPEKKAYRVKRAQLKLMDVVKSLRERGAAASADGLGKIVNGSSDPEAIAFRDLDSFGSLVSLNGKRCKGLVRLLVERDYLRQIYVEEEDEYFLALTAKGEEAVAAYRAHPHKKKPFVPTKTKKTIIKLSKEKQK